MPHSPVVLAFDTALFGCSVAVVNTETWSCVRESRPMARGQAEELVPMIESVLAKGGRDFGDIDLIGTTVGPGAFTGLRIGLATARALGLALDRPIMGVTTLEALARQYAENKPLQPGQHLAVLLETKRRDYYFQLFDSNFDPAIPASAMAGDQVADRLEGREAVLIGDALSRFHQEFGSRGLTCRLEQGYDLIDPAIIAKIAAERYSRQSGKIEPPEPLYLRPADVSKPKRKPRILAQ